MIKFPKLKRVYGLILITLLSFSTYGQEVFYSPYDDFDFRSGDYTVIGKVSGLLYVYRSSSDEAYLDAYYDNMERKAIVLLDFMPEKKLGVKFIAYKDRMIVLYQQVIDGMVKQYGAILDDAGRLLKEPVLLDEVKDNVYRSNGSNLYKLAVAEDKEEFAIYAIDEDRETIQAKVIWMDANLNIQTNSTLTFSDQNNIASGQAILADNGTFYLPAYTPLGSRDFADRVWLLKVSKGGSSFAQQEMPLQGQYAAGTYMELDEEKGRIYIGGFYSDKKNGNFNGILYTYYNMNTGTYDQYKQIAFGDNMRNASGERNKKKAFNDYKVGDLIVRNDGGFVLIAENFYMTARSGYGGGFGYYSWYSPGMASSIQEYHYEDVLVMAYNGDGVNEWNTFIRKDQYSQEDGGILSSYAMINTGGALGFLFNDFSQSISKIQLASVDAEGRVNVKPLIRINNSTPDFVARAGKQISSREVVIPCLRKRQICFAKIVF